MSEPTFTDQVRYYLHSKCYVWCADVSVFEDKGTVYATTPILGVVSVSRSQADTPETVADHLIAKLMPRTIGRFEMRYT